MLSKGQGQGFSAVPNAQGQAAPVPASYVADHFIITISCTSTASASTYALLFDVDSVVNAALSKSTSSGVTITGSTISETAIKNMIGRNPVFVTAINYQTDQTHETIKIHQANLDGTSSTKTISPFMAKRNTQEQTNLLTIPINRWLNSLTAWEIPLTASNDNNVTLGFFVKYQAGRVG